MRGVKQELFILSDDEYKVNMAAAQLGRQQSTTARKQKHDDGWV